MVNVRQCGLDFVMGRISRPGAFGIPVAERRIEKRHAQLPLVGVPLNRLVQDYIRTICIRGQRIHRFPHGHEKRSKIGCSTLLGVVGTILFTQCLVHLLQCIDEQLPRIHEVHCASSFLAELLFGEESTLKTRSWIDLRRALGLRYQTRVWYSVSIPLKSCSRLTSTVSKRRSRRGGRKPEG